MPENDDDLTLPGQPPRRTVLRGALALGAAGVLAGCGGSSSDNNAAAQTPADTAAAPQSTPSATAKAKKKAKAKSTAKPSASAKPTSEAKATAKPKATAAAAPKGGRELAPTSDIPVGGGKIFDDQKIVVTQPKKGEFLAFSAVCTHQDCIVADCDGGTINCGCHESSFSITDGHPLSGPAVQTGALAKKKVQVAGGKVYEV
jgi:nitrite reductase/ring-hydroxylating ferredoxin subunit